MIHHTNARFILSVLAIATTTVASCWGFTLSPNHHHRHRHHHDQHKPTRHMSSSPNDTGGGPASGMPGQELDEERRMNLFQALLRDLQVEGVPLLGCDAQQAETFLAATYTTMAEMSNNPEASKSCLVLEGLPIGALSAFCDDFATLKLQPRLIANLPEFERFSIELVGKGAGPALLIDAIALTPEQIEEKTKLTESETKATNESATAALKSFVERLVIQSSKGGTCPYTKTVELAPGGLEAKGVNPAQIGYRYDGSSSGISALAAFWTCVCELQQTPETELSTIVLSLPCIGAGTSKEAHDRFVAVVELISRSLCLFRGDSLFGLVHFHPAYDRSSIFPDESPAYGHLPPRSWLRAMMRMNGNTADAESMTDEELALSDYQRRAPHTAINILRVSQISAATGAKSIVDLDLGNGRTEKASGITIYSRNAITLARIGKANLDEGLQKEMAVTWSGQNV